jgi:hypothetical protein
MITNGRFPATHEMTTDEYGLRSMSDIDPVDLRMSPRQWDLQVITQGVSMAWAPASAGMTDRDLACTQLPRN